jgi:hypothetical protein
VGFEPTFAAIRCASWGGSSDATLCPDNGADGKHFCHVRRVEAVGMSKDVLIETYGNNIVVGMPGTAYRVRYRRPNSGRQLIAHQLPMGDDPSAPITSAQFMSLAWRIATDKARKLGWIAG